jgi:hypothetical protein
MAKNKKRKQQPRPVHSVKQSISKTHEDKIVMVARKIFQFFGADSSLLDSMTKRQRFAMTHLNYDLIHIRAAQPNTIPRRIVDAIRAYILEYLRTNYVGDPSLNFTFMDYVTYGTPIMQIVLVQLEQGVFDDHPRLAEFQAMRAAYDNLENHAKGADWQLMGEIYYQATVYSQPTFRTYGLDWSVTQIPAPNVRRTTALLTVHENEKKYFLVQNKYRIAYRLLVGQRISTQASWAVIRLNQLFPHMKQDKELNIYIQSHAIHRFKERFDITEPTFRNYILLSSLRERQIVVQGPKSTLLACFVAASTGNPAIIGYFAFRIDGDDLLILTFLPLVSDMTPEGKKLSDILHLTKEELIYLEMDKLSFYTSVDIAQIPILKEALKEAGFERMQEALFFGYKAPPVFDEKKTLFVKNFFEKTITYNIPDTDIDTDADTATDADADTNTAAGA